MYARRGTRRYGAKRGRAVSRSGVVSIVRNVLDRNTEDKRFDLQSNLLNPVTGPGLMPLLSGITQGSNFDQRTGLQVKMKRIVIRGRITFNHTATDTAHLVQYCRIALFLDADGKGVAPTVVTYPDNIWSPVNTLLVPSQPAGVTVAQRSAQNTTRFVILRDRLFSVSRGGPSAVTFHWVIKTRATVHFLANTVSGSIADAGPNSVWMGIFSDSGGGAAFPGPEVIFSSRIVYEDA